MLIRGSGLVAFGLVAGATIWGLVLSLGVLPSSVKRMTLVHESLSVGAVLATAVHMVALYVHDFVEFDLRAVLVPGAAQWRPVAVSWGTVSFYGLLIVVASFYVRRHIGQRYWRLLHFGSFGIFIGVLVHGIAAGTDSNHPAVLAGYAAAASIVLGLTAVRVAMILKPGVQRGSPQSGTAARSRSSQPARTRADVAP